MKMRRVSTLFMLAGMLLFVGCSDDDDPASPTIQQSAITISGSLQIDPDMTVPPDAKLCGIWDVDGNGGDYSYLYGEGSVDIQAGTFTLTLDAPPRTAMNISPDGRPDVGVGVIVLADFPDTKPHVVSKQEITALFGAVVNTGIIYIDGNPAEWASHPTLNWLAAFNAGFDVGEGKETNDTHDIWIPSSAQTFVLTISDDSDDFIFPNWK